MGVDVCLYAVGDVTDEELSRADTYLKERNDCGFGWFDNPEDSVLVAVSDSYLDEDDPHWGRVYEYRTLSRMYSEGYERGSWPSIYAAIRRLKAALPQCKVYYESDSYCEYEGVMEATDEYLEELWAHYLGPSGNAYRGFGRS